MTPVRHNARFPSSRPGTIILIADRGRSSRSERGNTMTRTYDPSRTAVLLVDPCNDFISEGGKAWPMVEPVATKVGLLDNLRTVMAAGVTHVIVIGLLANTCIESTARFAMELGYHVTLVRDATAAYRPEMMHAAHELNGPTFAHSIVTTAELARALEGGN
jgi:nicotinamidase-related amidase